MDEESKRLLDDCFLRPVADARSTNSHENHSTSKNRLKTELQLLTLSNESQEMIMNTLKYVHGQNFKLSDSSMYKDSGGRLKKSYWEDGGRLVIQGISNYANMSKETKMNGTDDRLRQYAIMKLQNYGFAEFHCEEAIDRCSRNVNEALELLFSKYMKCDLVNNSLDLSHTEDELLEMREEEKQALESIYDKNFEEKEKNFVWSIKLDVKHLLEYSPSESKKLEEVRKAEMLKSQMKKKEKCRNFAKGHCKFAEKCRFSHEVEEIKTKSSKNDENLSEFFLEIRFPKNSQYPYEAPLTFLKTTCPDMPPEILLRINRKLYKEAQQLAIDGMPCVYTISEFLQMRDEVVKIFDETTDDFPDANKSLFHKPSEKTIHSKHIEKNLPSHYKKGSTGLSDRSNPTVQQILRDDQIISKKFIQKSDNRNYQNMLKVRQNLPAWEQMVDILNTIENNQVVVISGETGCGKSTQVPQFILDDWLLEIESMKLNCQNNSSNKVRHVEIICTQPRRLSAIGVAERVAEERDERIGNTIGYQIRLESKISSLTRLTFCTTGILLQRLHSEPYLESVSHIIIDEVHERSEESDFLLMILKKILQKRKDLKVILMSATLNAELFSNYFGSVPILEIPGRTFPVEQIFLEDILEMADFILEQDSQYCRKLKKNEEKELENDLENYDVRSNNEKPSNKIKDENLNLAAMKSRYSEYSNATCKTLYLMDAMKINPELIETVIKYIVFGGYDWPKEGTILVFLPGYAEIQTVYEALCDSPIFNPRHGQFIIVPLHSTLSSEEQAKIFEKVPHNKRRIVLSTNIAETSVTIDDCTFVIDCGLMKEKRFDPNKNMESLELVWESRANAQQRKGRAGRVMPGVCIHLFTSNRYKYQFLSQPVPEILRVPLEQLILRIKTLPNFEGCDILDIIGQIVEPPTEYSIKSALVRLRNVGAIDETDELTALGHHLSVLPVDVRIGKLMLFGAIFQCLDSVLTIAACLSHKSPFMSPFNRRLLAEQKKRKFSIQNSDHLTFLNAYKKWNEICQRNKSKYSGRCYADENFLSWKTLESIADVKYQFLELLVTIGFVPIDLPRKRKNADDCILEITGYELNCNGDNNRLLISLLCAALYPNIVKVLKPEKTYVMTASGAVPQNSQASDLRFQTHEDGFVSIHPSSINHGLGDFLSPFIVYQDKIKTYKVFIRECSVVPLLPLILFSGSDFEIKLSSGDFIILLDNGWIMLKAYNHDTAEMIHCLRSELLKLLEEKIKDPCLNLLNHRNGKKVISTIVHLVTKE